MVTQTGRKSVKPPVLSPAKLAEITSAVRAFCVIYNTSMTYEPGHQVFQKAVDERLPVFRAALAGVREIPLFFVEGQIRVGSLPLEPGSGMFQKLSNEFETMGISSISFLPCISADDLKKLMKIVVAKSEEIAGRGLQHFLAKEGVAGVVENKVRTQIVSKDSPEAGGQVRGAGVAAASRRRRSQEAATAWDIDAGPAPFSPIQQAGNISGSRPVRNFVKGALEALGRNEARSDEVADIIATEFEHRIKEKVEEVRKAGERKVRHLENIKDLILKELENHNVAALILDSQLRILSANRLGHDIIGDASVVEKGSPLGIFVMSQSERQEVDVNGVVRTAHLLTTKSAGSGESLMLLSLE